MNACTVTRCFAATALLAAAATLATTAWAHDEAARSRADVKAETLAAMKAGELAAGEGSPTEKASPTAGTTRTREQRKAETLLARSRDELVHSGIATYRASISQQTATAHSTRTRDQRKAETMEAIKQRQIMPAGEAV